MKNKITGLRIVIGIVITCLSIVVVGGVIATIIIREMKSASQLNSNSSTPIVIEATLELDPASLTSVAALPTTTPSNELVEQVYVRHILTSDKDTAIAVLQKLKSGADWNEMCKQYSLDKNTIQAGCDLGWLRRGVAVEEYEILAFNAPVGEFIGPEKIIYGSNKIDYGWFIIQVLSHEMRPYSEYSP